MTTNSKKPSQNNTNKLTHLPFHKQKENFDKPIKKLRQLHSANHPPECKVYSAGEVWAKTETVSTKFTWLCFSATFSTNCVQIN